LHWLSFIAERERETGQGGSSNREYMNR